MAKRTKASRKKKTVECPPYGGFSYVSILTPYRPAPCLAEVASSLDRGWSRPNPSTEASRAMDSSNRSAGATTTNACRPKSTARRSTASGATGTTGVPAPPPAEGGSGCVNDRSSRWPMTWAKVATTRRAWRSNPAAPRNATVSTASGVGCCNNEKCDSV